MMGVEKSVSSIDQEQETFKNGAKLMTFHCMVSVEMKLFQQEVALVRL